MWCDCDCRLLGELRQELNTLKIDFGRFALDCDLYGRRQPYGHPVGRSGLLGHAQSVAPLGAWADVTSNNLEDASKWQANRARNELSFVCNVN